MTLKLECIYIIKKFKLHKDFNMYLTDEKVNELLKYCYDYDSKELVYDIITDIINLYIDFLENPIIVEYGKNLFVNSYEVLNDISIKSSYIEITSGDKYVKYNNLNELKLLTKLDEFIINNQIK